jgi:NitT/TauT family transport system substrate-binding protein
MKKWVLIVALFACVQASAQTVPAPEKPRLVLAVGGQALLYYLPLTIAQQKGFFKAQGLDVSIVDFAGGAKALQSLLGGSSDVVSGAYEHTISMQAKGQRLVAFALEGTLPGMALAVRSDLAGKVHAVRDLQGMKIGISAPGSATQMYLNMLLRRNGLTPNAVSVIGVGSGAGAVAALQKGEIDALVSVDPTTTLLERQGSAQIRFDTRTSAGSKSVYDGDYLSAALYSSAQFIAQNPRTVQALANAMVMALHWLAQATPDEIVAALPPSYYAQGKALYLQALASNHGSYSLDGRFSLPSSRRVLQALQSVNPQLAATDIDLAQTFDNRFVDVARQTLPPVSRR